MRVGCSRQQLLGLLLGLAGLSCIHSYLPTLPSRQSRSPLFRSKAAAAPAVGIIHQQRARYARQVALAASSFSNFFTERAANATAAAATASNGAGGGGAAGSLAYELRLLELEGRILKLEGMTARAGKGSMGQGGNAKGVGAAGSKAAAGAGGGSGQFSHILPDGEQLLLGCTFAGAVLGLLVGRALLSKQMYLGGVGGAVLGVHFFNKEGNFGACIRALGKLVLYACDRLAYAWSELKFNWKAWRVYERSFKKLESLDKEMQVSERIKSFDRQYQVSSNVNNWMKKFQSAAKTMEENLKEQAIYWQRAQRLREEQKQAQMIQSEIQRQQERERFRQGKNGGPVPAPSSLSPSYHGGGQGASPQQQQQQQQPQPPGGGGGFQAVVGDARWSDRSERHPSQHQQHQQEEHGGPSASYSSSPVGGISATTASFAAGGGGSTSVLSAKGPLFELNSFLKGWSGPTSTKTRSDKLRAAAAASAVANAADNGNDDGVVVPEEELGPVMGPAGPPATTDPFALASAPPMEDGGVVTPTGAVGGGEGQGPSGSAHGGGIGGGIRL